jgi:hypothetical protein
MIRVLECCACGVWRAWVYRLRGWAVCFCCFIILSSIRIRSHSLSLYTHFNLPSLSTIYIPSITFSTPHINKYAFLHIRRHCCDLRVRCCSGFEPGSRLRCMFYCSPIYPHHILTSISAPLLRLRRPGLRLLARRHKVPVHHRPRLHPEVPRVVRACAMLC